MTQYISVAADDRIEAKNGIIKLHGPEGFEGMRRAGRLAAEILDALAAHVVPGVSTEQLDDIVHKMTLDGGGLPATLGYRGYTKSSCISINHVVCHGIPSDKTLKDGDIVNIDVTPIVDGWHGDSSRMYLVGNVPLRARKLVDVTYECLMLGLEQAKPGNHLGDIANAIQRHAEAHRYSVVRDFCGHGVGRVFHDSPEVIHAGRHDQQDTRRRMRLWLGALPAHGRADLRQQLPLPPVPAADRHGVGGQRFHRKRPH